MAVQFWFYPSWLIRHCLKIPYIVFIQPKFLIQLFNHVFPLYADEFLSWRVQSNLLRSPAAFVSEAVTSKYSACHSWITNNPLQKAQVLFFLVFFCFFLLPLWIWLSIKLEGAYENPQPKLKVVIGRRLIKDLMGTRYFVISFNFQNHTTRCHYHPHFAGKGTGGTESLSFLSEV